MKYSKTSYKVCDIYKHEKTVICHYNTIDEGEQYNLFIKIDTPNGAYMYQATAYEELWNEFSEAGGEKMDEYLDLLVDEAWWSYEQYVKKHKNELK